MVFFYLSMIKFLVLLKDNKGYEISNVVPCCVVCNRVRGDHFSPEETKIAVMAVIEFKNQESNYEETIKKY